MSQPQESIQSDGETTDDIGTWKRIVVQLALQAPNQQIKSCIQTYDPEKPTKTNIKTLSETFRKDTIIDTLNFLSKQKPEHANKDDLVQKLCFKIQNYFPDTCQICSSSYTFKFDDKSFLQCVSCGQEAHKQCYLNLLKDMNLVDENDAIRDTLFKIPGIFFLCQSCQDGTVNFIGKNVSNPPNKSPAPLPDDFTEDDRAVSLPLQSAPLPDVFTKDEKEVSLTIQEDNSLEVNQTPRRSLPVLPNVIIANQNPYSFTQYTGRTEFMRNKVQKEQENNSALLSEDSRRVVDTSRVADSQNERSNNETCRFYKKGTCKHGLKGRDCTLYSPQSMPKAVEAW